MKARAKRALSQALWRALGRRNYVRLGRFLSMEARLDVPNDMSENGERLVQEALCRAAAATSGPIHVLDVGANAGAWSRYLVAAWRRASLPASRLHLHLFEPTPALRDQLGAALSAEARELGGLAIVGSAVSDREGSAVFHVTSEGSGRSSLVQTGAESGFGSVPARESIDVPLCTLDRYCAAAGIERVGLVKIDTEGNDCLVLRGARDMLRGGRIAMAQFEYNQHWIAARAYLKDVFDLVGPLGYGVGKVTPRGIETYRAWHYELESYREGNYLAWYGELPAGMPRIPWWMDPPG